MTPAENLKFLVNHRADRLPKCKRYLFGDGCHQNIIIQSGQRFIEGAGGDMNNWWLYWSNVEWEGEGPESLVLPHPDKDLVRELKCVILGDFPTRSAAVEYAVQNFTIDPKQLEQLQSAGG